MTESVTIALFLRKGLMIIMAFEKLEKEKQNLIVNAACEVFAKHGYQKASMKDIAATAKISKSVLFKYFSTKENLYVKLFRLASDCIIEADEIALAEGADNADMFSLIRLRAKSRLSLFMEYPWIYKFSYTAAFDADSFVKGLVRQELERNKKNHVDPDGIHQNDDHLVIKIDHYQGLRDDISPAAARQLIFWISQGYLEEKLHQDEIEPDLLEKGYEEWVDILELLLKDNNKKNDHVRQKDR